MPPVYISFSAELCPQTIEPLLSAILTHASKPETTSLTLLFSTPGGSVSSAMHVYHVLGGLPKPLTTHNVGDLQSIGLPIFLAGQTRYACRHASFTFHRVTY